MSRPWILITPASRGIGHALARHLLRTTTVPILATARSPNHPALQASLLADLPPEAASRLHLAELDVTDEAGIAAAAATAAELFPPASHHLHLALAVPGILHAEKALRAVHAADALMTFRVNTLGPLLLMKHFGEFLPKKRTELDSIPSSSSHPSHSSPTFTPSEPPSTVSSSSPVALPRHALWATMSARVGSTTDNRAGGWFSYRASKAGVNSLTRSFDLALRTRSGDKAMAVAYHPGTVRTDLSRAFWGGVEEEKLFSAEFAAARMVEVLTGRVGGVGGLEGRGRCWDWKGEEISP